MQDPFLTSVPPPDPYGAQGRSSSQPVRLAAASPVSGPGSLTPQTAPVGIPPQGAPPPNAFAGHSRAGGTPPGVAPDVDDPFLTHAAAARREDEPVPQRHGYFPYGFDYREYMPPFARQEGGHRETMFPEGWFGELLGPGDERSQKWIGYLYVFLPFGVFLLTLLLCLVLRHVAPTLAILLCALIGIFGIYCMLMEQIRTKHGDISLAVLGGLTTLAVVLGLIASSVGWIHYVRGAWWLQVGLTGRNVMASDPAASYNDAAWIQFSSDGNGTVVDRVNSAGYKDVDIFCAAPILEGPLEYVDVTTVATTTTTAPTTTTARNTTTTTGITTTSRATTTGRGVTTQAALLQVSGHARRIYAASSAAATLSRIEYWAVGINCCDEIGNFRCTGDEDFNSGVGYVLLDGGYPCPGCNKELFQKAVQKAEAAHGLVSAPGALKVQWMISASAYQTWVGWRVVLFVITASMLAFIVIAPLGWAANYWGIGRIEDPFEFLSDLQLLKMRGGRARRTRHV
mmetsp:Transcript_63333/g.151091  ORF Transcript_63333/g.151091 Transcript_63333/m.151091 type:complete len:512 (+) Transcript_63333:111-1646(+)